MELSIFDRDALARLRAQLRMDPRHLRRAINQFCKHFSGREAALGELPGELRDRFARQVAFHRLKLVGRYDSQLDGASKLVLRTAEGYLIEAVILRTGTGRVALCVSCQVGCAAACDFCATGKMGVATNLRTAEILDQVVQAGQLLRAENRSLRNIVFMGMGEPLHNEAVLYETLEALLAPQLFHHPAGRILVSTVGIPDAMLRCARRFPRVHLALSLHSVRQDARESLIPLAARYHLDELRETIAAVNQLQACPLMLEYLMLRGVNDSAEDAAALIRYAAGLRVHVNLIPYNPIDAAPQLVGTRREQREWFSRQLKAAGIATTIRYSLGSDIAAACGQLVQNENRETRQKLMAQQPRVDVNT